MIIVRKQNTPNADGSRGKDAIGFYVAYGSIREISELTYTVPAQNSANVLSLT